MYGDNGRDPGQRRNCSSFISTDRGGCASRRARGCGVTMTPMEIEELYGPQTYQKFPVTIVRGSGAEVWDDQGKRYVDCMGGYGVAIVGHCNPEVVRAVQRQAE